MSTNVTGLSLKQGWPDHGTPAVLCDSEYKSVDYTLTVQLEHDHKLRGWRGQISIKINSKG